MENDKKLISLSETTLKDKIYTIRGQRVMLDIDLAEIYGYETKSFNRQVKRNIERFDGRVRILEVQKWHLKLGRIALSSICFYRAGNLYVDDGA